MHIQGFLQDEGEDGFCPVEDQDVVQIFNPND